MSVACLIVGVEAKPTACVKFRTSHTLIAFFTLMTCEVSAALVVFGANA
jgi:hypothetical protein